MKRENLRIVIVSILFAYTVFFLTQRSFLYHPAKTSPRRAVYGAKEMDWVSFKNADGITLKGWYKKAKKGKATLIYFHGNAGHFGSRYRRVKPYLQDGFGALLFSYRGYAGNKGSPSEMGLYNDGQAAIDYLSKQGVNCQVYYGESLGTGVATQMALSNHPSGVILQSPYTSITEMAKIYYPWSPLGPWDEFDSLSKIDKIKSPLLILHGKKDSLIPYQHSVLLYEKATAEKSLKLYPKLNHNNVGGALVQKDIRAFLATINDYASKN